MKYRNKKTHEFYELIAYFAPIVRGKRGKRTPRSRRSPPSRGVKSTQQKPKTIW